MAPVIVFHYLQHLRNTYDKSDFCRTGAKRKKRQEPNSEEKLDAHPITWESLLARALDPLVDRQYDQSKKNDAFEKNLVTHEAAFMLSKMVQEKGEEEEEKKKKSLKNKSCSVSDYLVF